MPQFLIKSALSLLATLIIASIVVFGVLEILPGDAAQMQLGLDATPEAIANLRQKMGLDDPVIVRYLHWMGNMLTGNFGISLTYSVPVTELVSEAIRVSLPLALLALTLSTAIAIPVGVWAAARRGKASDTFVMAITQLGVAIPNFWFAMLLVYVFAIILRWVPSGGFPGWDKGFWSALFSLVLPAIALALPQAAILARITRSSVIEAMSEDYVRTARAKGLNASRTLWHHALRNALIPVITIMGLQFAFLLAGTIIIENVFYLPGIGRLIFKAITQRDIIVVESVVMLLVAIVIMVNFLVDLAYAVIDPRLRVGNR